MNDSNIVVALLSLIGTLTGSIAGVLVSNKLTNYRLEQLEKTIDKYASNVDDMRERLVAVEQSLKAEHKRLDGLVSQFSLKEKR